LLKGKNGKLYADNTDGVGLVSDISNNLSWQLEGASILLIGAGGASRGVLQPLLDKSPEMVFIANRTAEKARELAEFFSCAGGGFNGIPARPFDVIINASSASLDGDIPPLDESVISEDTCVYDMLYASEPTAFISWAAEKGCENTADGLGMLVEQAAEAFWIWRGVRPDTQPVIDAIRDQL
jgi:shikimate dehydrogenase